MDQGTELWLVQKFIPTRCPRCQNPFSTNGKDGFLYSTHGMHESPSVVESIEQSISHPKLTTDLVWCGRCKNATLRVLIAERVCALEGEAKEFIQQGFVSVERISHYGDPASAVLAKEFL